MPLTDRQRCRRHRCRPAAPAGRLPRGPGAPGRGASDPIRGPCRCRRTTASGPPSRGPSKAAPHNLVQFIEAGPGGLASRAHTESRSDARAANPQTLSASRLPAEEMRWPPASESAGGGGSSRAPQPAGPREPACERARRALGRGAVAPQHSPPRHQCSLIGATRVLLWAGSARLPRAMLCSWQLQISWLQRQWDHAASETSSLGRPAPSQGQAPDAKRRRVTRVSGYSWGLRRRLLCWPCFSSFERIALRVGPGQATGTWHANDAIPALIRA